MKTVVWRKCYRPSCDKYPFYNISMHLRDAGHIVTFSISRAVAPIIHSPHRDGGSSHRNEECVCGRLITRSQAF